MVLCLWDMFVCKKWHQGQKNYKDDSGHRIAGAEGDGERRSALNHRRTSVSLLCTDFIDYFTAGNIVNLFIPWRVPLASLCGAPTEPPIAPII